MGIWDWDISADSMWWDERIHALFGLPPNSFKGCYDDFLKLIQEEDRERIRGEFAKAISTRTAVDTEFQITWPSDHSEHLVRIRSKVDGDPNAKIERIVGVAWDITERRQAHLALDKERSLLTTLMDKLPYRFYFKDLDSRFVAVSRALATDHGRKDPAEMVGLTDRDLFSSEHAAAYAENAVLAASLQCLAFYYGKAPTFADQDSRRLDATRSVADAQRIARINQQGRVDSLLHLGRVAIEPSSRER